MLGEAEPASITITRDLAEALQESIQTLVNDPGDPEIYTREACWRDIRSRRWSQVVALQNRIGLFLASPNEEMPVSDVEWSLIESVIECVEAIGSLAHESTTSTLNTVGALIGVAGGIATLVALF